MPLLRITNFIGQPGKHDQKSNKGRNANFFTLIVFVSSFSGIEPITVVTHYDLLPEQERETVRREASEATGSSLSYTLFIWNYTKENRDRNTEKERMALEILQRAVEESERAVIRVMEETGLFLYGLSMKLVNFLTTNYVYLVVVTAD